MMGAGGRSTAQRQGTPSVPRLWRFASSNPVKECPTFLSKKKYGHFLFYQLILDQLLIQNVLCLSQVCGSRSCRINHVLPEPNH